jgi:hypothetical protein
VQNTTPVLTAERTAERASCIAQMQVLMGYKFNNKTHKGLSIDHMGDCALRETLADLEAGPPTGHAPAGSEDGLAVGYSLLDLKNRIKINLHMRKDLEMELGLPLDLMNDEQGLRKILATVLARPRLAQSTP